MENKECCRQTLRPEALNNSLINRLNRIEGQVRGIKGMLERGVYCDDILTQIAAVKSAMNSVGKILLESHIKTCVAPKLKAGDAEIVQEFIKTLERML